MKNRGCCWYFPKYELLDIYRLIKSKEGEELLNKIINLQDVKIYKYYIHVGGYFERDSYEEYLNSFEGSEDKIKDKSIYFRACPFVKDGEGCTIPAEFRSFVCNFYICEEIYLVLNKYKEFKRYIDERNSYIKWFQYENEYLKRLLVENDINLSTSFKEVVELFKNTTIDQYEFINLEPVIFNNDLS